MEESILEAVQHYHIIVALRGVSVEQMVPTAKALLSGGIHMLEVTFNQKSAAITDTPAAIELIKKEFGPQILVGAGTVMTVQQVQLAAEAGAQYLLSPNFDPNVMAEAQRRNIPMIPGAMTPSEIAAAWNAGAALVKLFPADRFGLDYVKAIAAPMGHIPLLGMGGIHEQNLLDYLRLPTMAGVGIGSGIAKKSLIQSKDWGGLTAIADKYTKLLNSL